MSAILPQVPGLLPKWLLFVSVLSIANTVQSFVTLTYTRRIYTRVPAEVTPLSGRTFGLWTLFSGIIRLYGAYNLESAHVYRAVLLTYAIAWIHFVSEVVVFKSAGLSGAVRSPLVVASLSLAWMAYAWSDYVVYP